MHELSLCTAIARIVDQRAAGRRVERVRLRIGTLRQVVPTTLAHCWEFVTAESSLAGSLLDIESVPARIRCAACGHEQDLDGELSFTCSHCASSTVTVVAGEEFLVASMDVAPAARSAAQ